MVEKFKDVFVAKKQHSLSEIIRTADEFNKKYVEVMTFIADHREFIPWIRVIGNMSRYIENEDYRLYDNLALYRKSTNTCILNNLGIYHVLGERVELRHVDITEIDPTRIDYMFEHDSSLFDEWTTAVDELLTAALLTK